VRTKLAEFQQSYARIQTQSQQMNDLLARGRAQADQLQAQYRRAHVLEETVGELRAVRDAVGLDHPIDTPERLRRASLNYEQAKSEVRARYLARDDSGPQYEHFEPEVVFEAVDLYVTLNMGGGDDGQLWLTTGERTDLLGALAYVLTNLPEISDPTQPGHARLLLDRKVRDMFAFIVEDADPAQRSQIREELQGAFAHGTNNRARDNLALALAELGSHDGAVRDRLGEMRQSKRAGRAAPAALALAKLGATDGLSVLTAQLEQDSPTAYAAACLLAQAGASGLDALAGVAAPRLQGQIERVLRAHRPRNCFEERYANYLLTCLRGPCPNLPAASEKDGECPRYSAGR
jgi:hypothetical protein